MKRAILGMFLVISVCAIRAQAWETQKYTNTAWAYGYAPVLAVTCTGPWKPDFNCHTWVSDKWPVPIGTACANDLDCGVAQGCTDGKCRKRGGGFRSYYGGYRRFNDDGSPMFLECLVNQTWTMTSNGPDLDSYGQCGPVKGLDTTTANIKRESVTTQTPKWFNRE